jgi:hypothetical protein
MIFEAKLYKKDCHGELRAYGMGATIECETRDDAVRRAKEWSKTVDVVAGSCLKVFYGDGCITSLSPGDF